MSGSVYPKISRDQAWARLPAPLRAQIRVGDLPPTVTYISFGVDKKDVVRRGPIQKILDSLGVQDPILVAGPNFTAEALDLLRRRSATVLSLGDFHWTEASLDAVS